MGRLRPADVLAGAAGIALLVVEFLPWYGGSATAWQAFSVVDVLLALAALAAVALVVVTATASGPARPVACAVISTVAAAIALLIALWRLIDPPDGHPRHYGVWLGLAATLLMLVFSFLALKDDRTPGAVPPDVPRRPVPPA
jgi:hypothetical protein